MDSIRHDLALKIIGLSDRGEITLDAIERLLIAYDTIKQEHMITPEEVTHDSSKYFKER